MQFAALGPARWECHGEGWQSPCGGTGDGSLAENHFASPLRQSGFGPASPFAAAITGCSRAWTFPGSPLWGPGDRPTSPCPGASPSSSASRQEEAAPAGLFPRQVALPTNYSTCKSMSRAYSLAINQYKVKGHLVCFCNNAL